MLFDNADVQSILKVVNHLEDRDFKMENDRIVSIEWRGTQVRDLKPLSALKELRSLTITSYLEDRDLTPLNACMKLEELDLWGNKIKDIAPLAGLRAMRKLTLSYNSISNLAPLKDMTALTELSVDHNSVKNVKPLKALTKLEKLDLSRNKIEDIDSLADMVLLKNLNLGSNKISSIESLQKLTGLTELDLGYNHTISDISALAKLVKIVKLDIGNNAISDISALRGMLYLIELDLDDNKITDISALGFLRSLTKLNMRGNTIENISALSGLVNLTEISMGWNQICDISALQNLQQLSNLRAYNNKIEDVSPLSGIKKLTSLDVEENYIADFSVLDDIMANPLTLKSQGQKVEAARTTPVKTVASSNPENDKPLPAMPAFKGDEANKRKLLVGIAANTNPAKLYSGKTIGGFSLATIEDELGIPALIAETANEIHDRVDESKNEWPIRFANAINPGADLSTAWARFFLWLWEDAIFGAKNYVSLNETNPDNLAQLDFAASSVLALYRRLANGNMPAQQDWQEALKYMEVQSEHYDNKSRGYGIMNDYKSEKLATTMRHVTEQLTIGCRIIAGKRREYDTLLGSRFFAVSWGFKRQKNFGTREVYEQKFYKALTDKFIELVSEPAAVGGR